MSNNNLYPESNTIVSFQDVSILYGKYEAVRNIYCDIPKGKITALIGPSGCGKSTLLRSINRMNDLIRNCSLKGRVLYEGQDLYSPNIDPIEVRRKIGMVFQQPNPFPKSIYENIAFGARVNGYKGDMDELVERALRKAAVWDECKDKLKESGCSLSGGQQQRLCIARTIAIEPDVILMDEPCSALDPISTLKIEETVALVAQWLDNTQRTETRNERRQSKRLSALISDPEGVAFTMDFVDRVARHRDNKAAANQLSRLARERKLPSFLNFFDKTMLQVGARIAPFLPNFVMPIARFRMRSLIGHLVVDAENEAMHKHLNSRKAQGYACNVNLLGEAVLGEAEAEKRFKQTLALVSDPEVDYVSVKVSSITSQINLWAFDHTLQRIEERLRILFSHAVSTTPPILIEGLNAPKSISSGDCCGIGI